MVGWLKKKLRDWLREDQPDDNYLDVLMPDEQGDHIVKYEIVGRRGMRLIGQGIGTRVGKRLLGPQDVVDKEKFSRLLEKYLGDAKLTWVKEE